MPEDASLTDFASGDGADDESVSDDGVAEARDGAADGDEAGTGEPTATADVEPAETTFAWSPDGVCEACGESAERRWRDEAGLVCGECKEW